MASACAGSIEIMARMNARIEPIVRLVAHTDLHVIPPPFRGRKEQAGTAQPNGCGERCGKFLPPPERGRVGVGVRYAYLEPTFPYRPIPSVHSSSSHNPAS